MKASKSKGQGDAKINTDKISLLLDMIKEADVTSEENLAENETLLELEGGYTKLRWPINIIMTVVVCS